MSAVHTLLDLVLHLDRHLAGLLMAYHGWVYPIVFGIIFAETGLVVTPFLPGDSLLFGLGALAAVDRSGTLHAGWLYLLLTAAAVAGNTVNYEVGRRVGDRAFSGRHRFFKQEHLRRTEAYFHRYGSATILLSRFMPIVRTFAPFVAGIGHMPLARFQLFNIAGAAAWVALFLFAGVGFGNLPWVRDNFGLVTLAVVIVSLLPLATMALRQRRQAGRSPG